MIEECHSDALENILYELLIYAEWQQDPEIQAKSGSDKEEDSNSACVRKWWKSLGSEPCPPSLVRQIISLQMPWMFAVGGNGAVVAILQDSSLEIRTSRDEYGTIIGRTEVSKDAFPQWRRILWSPDCTMLALAHSNGTVDFYDLIGAHMFTIENKEATYNKGGVDLGLAAAGMAFSDVRIKDTQWSYEFLIADYHGTLRGYFISPSDGFAESHRYSFSTCYPMGISCFLVNPLDGILVVCGKSFRLSALSTDNEAAQFGLSTWRMLSGEPFYKMNLSVSEQMVFLKSNKWNILQQYALYQSYKQDLVFKMSLSPSQKILAAVHVSGALSLWDLPTLRMKKFWPLQLQPNFADINPQFCEPGMKRKADYVLGDMFCSHIIDINWWSDESIIMVRRCGAVTVSSTASLKNLLGISPEWFEPSPAVSASYDRGFLAMESEVTVKSKKRRSDSGELDDAESSEDEEPSVFATSANLAKRVLFAITDSDRFQPPKKKIKVLSRTYRLLCLKSTTPEELYARKITNEEYGEALALAKSYDLDCDLVYQRQWRKTPATVNTITDYLSKITKRSWVLHECMERVPDSFEATKELLLYGLQGTDLEALIAIGKGEDHGKFISSSISLQDSLEDVPYSYGDEYADLYEAKKTLEEKKRNELLKQVNFKKLTLEQKQLCQCRLKLLTYLDRLLTYENILGGPILTDENYDPIFFKKFRSQCGLEASLFFACNSNWEAVAAMFTYHGSETLSHRLTVLSHFPETTSPLEYQSLLPLFNEHKSEFYPWDEHYHREPDWCETKYQKTVVPSEEYVDEFYERNQCYSKFRSRKFEGSLVTEWFVQRAHEIEERTGLVDYALQLIELGVQRNIMGLEKLYDDLLTMDILIYQCMVINDLRLVDYQKMADFDKVKLIMSTTSKDNFIKNLRQWLLPFLEQCDRYTENASKYLLRKYVLSISKMNLEYCIKILENSNLEEDCEPVISNIPDLVSLAFECVYNCESADELNNARCVHHLLSSLLCLDSEEAPNSSLEFEDDVDKLLNFISVADLLNKNGHPVSFTFLKSIFENEEEVKKMLVKLTRMASHRFPVLDDQGWVSLLADILEMQSLIFHCISEEDCYEIVLQSLLCSGKTDGIALAGRMMECKKKHHSAASRVGTSSFKLCYDKSVKLVLAAAQEYFNSSGNSRDPCMSLAKTCLNLIEDVPPSIEEELNLISAVPMLQDFNVNILPLQVRLCENRISLIFEALQKSDRSYKKSSQLLMLAHLLRAHSSNKSEREEKVLTLIAERAFQVKDFKECLNICKKLIDGGYENGWLICFTLGSCNEFQDLNARNDLLSFSVSFCSDDLIETILKKQAELHLQMLQSRVKYLVGDEAVVLSHHSNVDPANDQETADGKHMIWQTSEKTYQALQATTETTKAVLTSVKSTRFWKDAINWIQPLGWNEENSVQEESNSNLAKQGVCAFYAGLHENPYISRLGANYERFALPDPSQSLEIAFSILRACLLEDSLKQETSKSCVESSVVLDVCKAYLPEDFMLSFSVLLSLEQPEEAEKLFQNLPNTPIVLQFASLFYAFKLLLSAGICPLPLEDNSHPGEPEEIIQRALDFSKSEKAQTSEESKKLCQLLETYTKMLYDFVQAEMLQSIGGGVDAKRFTYDDEYKKDTILGISMTLDDNIFLTAVSLAKHYNLPLWDLYFTHLEFLFSDSNITAAVISERCERLMFLPKLLEQKKLFEKLLRTCIYPGIYGKDHDKLNLYFSYLEMCGDSPDDLGLIPSLHKALLGRFSAAMKGIDYKQLMSPDHSMEYLMNIINESSVHVFAKAAFNIPKQDGSFYDPGNIYSLWAKKFFFEGSSTSPKCPLTKIEWIHRFESCTDTFQKLGPPDVLDFVDAAIFSEKSLENMTIDSRAEVVKRVLKFSRSKVSKSKNDIVLSEEWGKTVSVLMDYYKHLQRLEDETIQQLMSSFDPRVRAYYKDFDLSKSSVEKLQKLLTRIVLEGPDLEMLQNFLSCCPENIGWEPSDAYIKAIYAILDQMKDPKLNEYDCFRLSSPLQILENVLDDMSKEKDELMIEDVAVDILNDFCKESCVSVTIRLGILQLLEKSGCLCPEYGDLLLLYRTQAIVSAVWPDVEVSDEDVDSESGRHVLFEKLLNLSETVSHYDALIKLLNYWPPIPPEQWQGSQEPWSRILSGLVSLSSRDALDTVVDSLEKALVLPTFTRENCQCVFRKLKDTKSLFHILKYALRTNYKELHDQALEVLKEKPEVTSEDYDSVTLDLILRHKLTSKIVTTGLYKPAVQFLLQCQDDNLEENYKSIDTVVKELHDSGYEIEAASLLHIKYSTHTGLSTYSSARSLLIRWLRTFEQE